MFDTTSYILGMRSGGGGGDSGNKLSLSGVAEIWQSDKQYAKDDVVAYNGKVYIADNEYAPEKGVAPDSKDPDEHNFWSETNIVSIIERKDIESMTNIYDSMETYNVGDFCNYDGDYYICKNATTSVPSVFDPDNWTKIGNTYLDVIKFFGGSNDVELTQSEYDALPLSEKMNGKTYFVKDGESPSGGNSNHYGGTEPDSTLGDDGDLYSKVEYGASTTEYINNPDGAYFNGLSSGNVLKVTINNFYEAAGITMKGDWAHNVGYDFDVYLDPNEIGTSVGNATVLVSWGINNPRVSVYYDNTTSEIVFFTNGSDGYLYELSASYNTSITKIDSVKQKLKGNWFDIPSGGSTTHTYSTEEQVVGTFIDGKTIYEKSIPYEVANWRASNTFSNVVSDPGEYVQIFDSVPDIDRLLSAEILTDLFIIKLFNVYIANKNNKTIGYGVLATPASNTKYITIQYTKTTD